LPFLFLRVAIFYHPRALITQASEPPHLFFLFELLAESLGVKRVHHWAIPVAVTSIALLDRVVVPYAGITVIAAGVVAGLT
jgi:hypothetical protein